MKIIISDHCGNFAENKDIARKLREEIIRPAYNKQSEKIIIDFSNIDSSTQSFVHALISDFFQKYGESALDKFEFSKCNASIKSLVTTVINYSLE